MVCYWDVQSYAPPKLPADQGTRRKRSRDEHSQQMNPDAILDVQSPVDNAALTD
jgi:hypothetical protein